MTDFINPIFLVLLLLFAGALIAQWRYLSGSSGSSEDLQAIQQNLELPVSADQWLLHGVEMVSSDDRVGAIVAASFIELSADQRRRALTVLAREIYRRTQVEVVLVEGRRPDAEPDLYLFAPDGRGWWGREILSEALSGRDFTATHRR